MIIRNGWLESKLDGSKSRNPFLYVQNQYRLQKSKMADIYVKSNSSLEGLRNSRRIQFKQTYESKYKVLMPFK